MKKNDGSGLLENTNERIEKYRKADITIILKDPNGKQLPGESLKIRQTKHSFLFGCNIFRLGGYDSDSMNSAYEERFTKLLNFATLPFYWNGFEKEKDKPEYKRLDIMAQRCKKLGLVTKGHPLIWHESMPEWAPKDIAVLEKRLKDRMTEIISHYKGLINIWDVINEASVSHRFQNPVGEWIREKGDDKVVGMALDWAHSANKDALLLVNDFNVSPEYENQLEKILKQKKPVNVIGIQSHMHQKHWELSRAWEVCDTYSRFELPLHFTELTVLSGRFKAEDDKDWHTQRDDWPTTKEGEKLQNDYVEKLYRVLFSHPSVFAITWWDFFDGGWQGAPAGLVRKDLSLKPVYETLMNMIKKEWWTERSAKTDKTGKYRFRGFLGDYSIEARGKEYRFLLTKKTKSLELKIS